MMGRHLIRRSSLAVVALTSAALASEAPLQSMVNPEAVEALSSLSAKAAFMAAGFGLVAGILILLWGICNINYWVARLVTGEGRKQNQTASTPAPAVSAPVTPQADQARLVAILTAAAYEAIGKPVRVVRFLPTTHQAVDWTMQGRMANHASHKFSTTTRIHK